MSLDPALRVSLLESDSKLKVFNYICFNVLKIEFVFKAKVKDLLCDLETYHQTFFPLLRCLHHITHNLPEAPLGRKVRN